MVHMTRTILFFVGVLAIVALAFMYLNGRTPEVPNSFDDATKVDRCAEFRQVDSEDKDIYSLGYSGRIRQLLHGCF